MMEKDLDDSIESRCDLALQKNKVYSELQGELANAHKENNIDAFSEISYRMQTIAVRCCYKLAIKDMHNIVNE